ncbi:hypothetical protein D3C80_2045400 [compost metagenome]
MLHHTNLGTVTLAAHAEARTQRAHATLRRVHDIRSATGILGGLDQGFALMQRQQAHLPIEVHVQSTVGVEVDLAAISQL